MVDGAGISGAAEGTGSAGAEAVGSVRLVVSGLWLPLQERRAEVMLALGRMWYRWAVVGGGVFVPGEFGSERRSPQATWVGRNGAEGAVSRLDGVAAV